MQRVPLFISFKERSIAFAAILLLFMLHLGYEYWGYHKLLSKKIYHTKAYVLNQYYKKDRYVLKMRAKEGFVFYTTSKENLKDLRDREVRVLLFRSHHKPTFLDYIFRFYYPSYILAVLPKSILYRLKEFIYRQHESPFFKELFSALFLATSMQKEYRDILAAFGISHLVAISGFHLGLVVSVVSFLLFWALKPLWQRFVPYLNLTKYTILFSLAIAGAYVAFLGYHPSMVRAFFLMAFGFFLFDRHIELVSFETLFWVVLVILAIFPRFLFSLGFWFSVAGVFYIYLFLHHFSFKNIVSFIAINVWLFCMMLPYSLYFFHTFSPMQLLSPLLSILFVLFYPIAFVLHSIGFGGVLDSFLGFLHSIQAISVHIPLWFVVLFALLSIFSIYRRAALLLLFGMDVALIYYIA